MEKFDVRCPICDTVNKDIFLEETNGWMECEHCRNKVKVLSFEFYKGQKIPLLTPKQLAMMYRGKVL